MKLANQNFKTFDLYLLLPKSNTLKMRQLVDCIVHLSLLVLRKSDNYE